MKTNKAIKMITAVIIVFCYLNHPFRNINAQPATSPGVFVIPNNENFVGRDIHIEFNTNIQDPKSWIPANAFNNSNMGNVTLDLFGPPPAVGVPANGSFTLNITFPQSKPGKILRYQWSRTGIPSTLSIGSNWGPLRKDVIKSGKTTHAMAPSTGNGTIIVNVLSTDYIFHIPPGVPGDVTAQLFATFIESIPTGVVEAISSSGPTPLNQVIFFFNVYGYGDNPNFTVLINQDSTQNTDFSYIEPCDIPTVSEWGLIILSLSLLAAGMVFIRKRHISLAIAGGAVVSEERKSLFMPRSFFIILAILWGILLSVVMIDAIITVLMPVKDVIGLMITCVILAYILHLLDAFRKE